MCWDLSLNLPLNLEGIDRLQTRWSQRGLLELYIYGARAFGQFLAAVKIVHHLVSAGWNCSWRNLEFARHFRIFWLLAFYQFI
ncbi:hypothetical protein CsSME_00024524 [Camellia sinensis var. sinensis]